MASFIRAPDRFLVITTGIKNAGDLLLSSRIAGLTSIHERHLAAPIFLALDAVDIAALAALAALAAPAAQRETLEELRRLKTRCSLGRSRRCTCAGSTCRAIRAAGLPLHEVYRCFWGEYLYCCST